MFKWLDALINPLPEGPAVNVDGTPMAGDIDINGNPYGVTSDDSFSSFDSFDSGGGGDF